MIGRYISFFILSTIALLVNGLLTKENLSDLIVPTVAMVGVMEYVLFKLKNQPQQTEE